MKFYIDKAGVFLGGWDANPPEGSIEVDPPEYADQVWLFPGWTESKEKLKQAETDWQTEEMRAIANQLLALEEEAADALSGDRKAWLAYRTKVRLWHESPDFPEQEKRPVRPS